MGRGSRCNTPVHCAIKNGTITSDSEDFNAIMQVVLCNKPIYRIGVTKICSIGFEKYQKRILKFRNIDIDYNIG